MASIDFSGINQSINNSINKLKAYLARLNDTEKYGWLIIIAGIVLLIVGAIMW